MYCAGKQRWPNVEVDFDVFAAHCERAIAPEWGEDARSHAAELYLCCGCVLGNAKAAQAFASEAAPVARGAIARIRHDPDFVQETLQELWGKLLLGPAPKVGEYSGRGSLHAWLKVAAARMALDRLRRQKVQRRDSTSLDDAVAGATLGPDLALIRARYGDAFQAALASAVASLSVRERNVLRSHAVGGCSIDHIGTAYGVHRATAARWLERARRKIYDTVRAQLKLRYRELTETEFRSLARALGSQLEIGTFASHDGTADSADAEPATGRGQKLHP